MLHWLKRFFRIPISTDDLLTSWIMVDEIEDFDKAFEFLESLSFFERRELESYLLTEIYFANDNQIKRLNRPSFLERFDNA